MISEQVQELLVRARNAFRIQDYDTAKTLVQQMLDEYPDSVTATILMGIIAGRTGEPANAIRAFKRALELDKRSSEAYNNLAAIYSQRGDQDRVNEFLDKALAIDPLYPFPLTGRALQALTRGDVAAAKDLLKPLAKVRKWHPLGAAIYHKTLARIALYEQDYDAAQRHVDVAKKFNEDDSEIPALETRIGLGRLSKAGDWFKDYDERSRQRRLRKPLSADPTLADCLGLLSKGDMLGICRVVDSGGPSSAIKVAALRQHLWDRLTGAGFVEGLVADLNDREQAALRDLLARGGIMPRAAFTATYGGEDERPYLEYHAATMVSVPGRLRARGLLFEGTSAGQVIVAIPRELRPLVAAALA